MFIVLKRQTEISQTENLISEKFFNRDASLESVVVEIIRYIVTRKMNFTREMVNLIWRIFDFIRYYTWINLQKDESGMFPNWNSLEYHTLGNAKWTRTFIFLSCLFTREVGMDERAKEGVKVARLSRTWWKGPVRSLRQKDLGSPIHKENIYAMEQQKET